MTLCDKMVLLLACALVMAGYTLIWSGGGLTPTTAVIRSGDEPPVELPLNRDQRLQVAGPLGVSTLEIRRGQARFVDSPCPNKLCVHSGWLARSGASAICVPNRISLLIRGRRSEYDAVVF